MSQNFEMMAGGSPASTLWDELVHTQSVHAAAGFIYDMFEHYDLLDGVREKKEATDAGLDANRSQVKEDLMHILDDNDGSKFRDWLKVYKSNAPATEDGALYASEFERQAFIWACQCCEKAQ